MHTKKESTTIYYDNSAIDHNTLEDFAIHLGQQPGKYLVAMASEEKTRDLKEHLNCVLNDVESYIVTDEDALQDTINNVNAVACSCATVVVTTHRTLLEAFADGLLKGVDAWSLNFFGAMDMFSTQIFNFNNVKATEFLTNFFAAPCNNPDVLVIQPTEQGEKLINHIMQACQSMHWPSNVDKNFIECMGASNMTVVMAQSDYNKVGDVKEGSYHKAYAVVSMLAMLSTDIWGAFKTVTIRSPFFEKSMAYAILQKQGLTLQEKCLGNTGQNVHTNGKRLHLYYVTDAPNSTNYKATRPDPKKREDYEDYIVAYCMGQIGAHKFVFSANEASMKKSVYTKYLSKTGNPEDGQGVPAISHNIEMQGYHHAIYTHSNNLSESDRMVLSAFGVDKDVIDKQRTFLHAYELVAATSLGNPNATEDVHVYVVDEDTATMLSQVYPGASVAKVKIPMVKSWKKTLSEMPMSYNDYKSFQRVNRRYNEGARKFSKKAALRYIEYCEAGGRQLVNENPTYTFMKENYG